MRMLGWSSARRPGTGWAIGIYEGDSPLRLAASPRVRNPVLTDRDVTDVPAAFVADPFLLRRADQWHLFFEVLNLATENGEIGHATSADGLAWQYQRIVLAEPFHLSYPHVFEWEGECWMVPETHRAGAVLLYRADDFPGGWNRRETLLQGLFVDCSLLRFAERWWMFACSAPREGDTLSLFFADDLRGPWREHPRSPVVRGDKGRGRPGGRVVVWGGRPVRFAQDCRRHYGERLRAFRVLELTPEDYREEEVEESPVLVPPGEGWNALAMHHVDPQPWPEDPEGTPGRWIACVDGERER